MNSIIVHWPESQEIIDTPYIGDCTLINDEKGLAKHGSSAYYVPEDIYYLISDNNVKIDPQYSFLNKSDILDIIYENDDLLELYNKGDFLGVMIHILLKYVSSIDNNGYISYENISEMIKKYGTPMLLPAVLLFRVESEVIIDKNAKITLYDKDIRTLNVIKDSFRKDGVDDDLVKRINEYLKYIFTKSEV